MIEDVEYFCAKLHLKTLAERNALAEAHVNLPGARPSGNVARSIAESSWRRNGKRRRIDPLRNRLPSRRSKRYAWNQVRSLIVGIAVRSVSRIAINGDIDREAGMRVDNRVPFPSAENAARNSGLAQIRPARAERQFINEVCVQIVACIECPIGPLTWLAVDVLRNQLISISAAVRSIVNFVRPHIVHGYQQPAGERTF